MRTVPMAAPEFTVMVAEPGAMPVTNPVAETVTADGLELDQMMVRPVSTLPVTSLSVAVSCRDWPIATVADCGLTVTDAAGVALGAGTEMASGVGDGVALGTGVRVASGTAARVAVGVGEDPLQATSRNAAKVKMMGKAKIFCVALSVAMWVINRNSKLAAQSCL